MLQLQFVHYTEMLLFVFSNTKVHANSSHPVYFVFRLVKDKKTWKWLREDSYKICLTEQVRDTCSVSSSVWRIMKYSSC